MSEGNIAADQLHLFIERIERLEEDAVVKLGDADRVRLVTNLMTVLVGDSEAQPVVSVDHA